MVNVKTEIVVAQNVLLYGTKFNINQFDAKIYFSYKFKTILLGDKRLASFLLVTLVSIIFTSSFCFFLIFKLTKQFMRKIAFLCF